MNKPEEIKKWLKKCPNADCSLCQLNFHCDIEAEALEYIQQLENQIGGLTEKVEQIKEEYPKWISVEDRLPERDGAYLVTTNSFGDRQSVKLRWFAKDGEMVEAYDLAGQKDVWYLYDIECGYVSIKSIIDRAIVNAVLDLIGETKTKED